MAIFDMGWFGWLWLMQDENSGFVGSTGYVVLDGYGCYMQVVMYGLGWCRMYWMVMADVGCILWLFLIWDVLDGYLVVLDFYG